MHVVLREVDFVTTFREPSVFATIVVVVLAAFKELCVGVCERTPFKAADVKDVGVVTEGGVL